MPTPHAQTTQTARHRTTLTALILGIVSLTLFLWKMSNPPAFYYDEAQYVASARAFLAGAPNPNPEAPPLGKLMIAASMKALGDNPVGWRAIGALCGALTLVGIFLWSHLLLDDYRLALTATLLTLFDNFLFVMSRVAMMDIFLVTFLTGGLLAFTYSLDAEQITLGKRRLWMLSSGVLLGLACACKWNGIDTLVVVGTLTFALLFIGKRSENAAIRRYQSAVNQIGTPTLLVSLFLLPVAAYIVTYWPLCRSMHLPFNLKQIVAMNVFIWRFHRAVPGNPAIASKWYSWMVQFSPQRSLSYLVGNWAVMWGGLLATIYCARRFGRSFPHTLLVLLYAANLAQWAVTPQTLLYYYYYFPASLLLGVSIALALKDLPPRVWGVRSATICVLAAACIFLFCFPHMAHLEAPFDCALGCWP
jgi:dolichyl-phosphate-mannose-protein mannosyltransferase